MARDIELENDISKGTYKKLEIAKLLYNGTRDTYCKWFFLASSVAVSGNKYQSLYSYANMGLLDIAKNRLKSGYPATYIEFPAISGTGRVTHLTKIHEHQNLFTSFKVIPYQTVIRTLNNNMTNSSILSFEKLYLKDDVKKEEIDVPINNNKSITQKQIHDIVSDALGYDKIDSSNILKDLGLDSMAAQIISSKFSNLGLNISSEEMLEDNCTINLLCDKFNIHTQSKKQHNCDDLNENTNNIVTEKGVNRYYDEFPMLSIYYLYNHGYLLIPILWKLQNLNQKM